MANHARSNPLLRFWEVYLTRWESNLVACLRNVCLIQTISNSSVIHDDPFNGEKIEFLCSFWKTSFARTISFNFYLNWDSFNFIFFLFRLSNSSILENRFIFIRREVEEFEEEDPRKILIYYWYKYLRTKMDVTWKNSTVGVIFVQEKWKSRYIWIFSCVDKTLTTITRYSSCTIEISERRKGKSCINFCKKVVKPC